MLLYLGQRLLPSSRREAAKSAMSELVSALERLKRARIGALIVLQGDFDVMSVATGVGTDVDAALRAETLIALCIPHAANTAHDGAIIVEDFRMRRAGVILPLSAQTLDPRFGTRHRGAIGVSEETDALVLIVSEERGELRIAQRGVISEALEVSTLERHVEDWLAAPREDRKRERGAAESSLSSATMERVELSQSGLIPAAVLREEGASRSQTHMSKAAAEATVSKESEA